MTSVVIREAVVIAALAMAAACGDGAPDSPTPQAPPGSIRVTAAISGVDVPPGFEVRWKAWTVTSDRNNEAQLETVTPGLQYVELIVAINCQVDGENPRAVTVASGQSVTVSFSVVCVSVTGFVRVSVATGGVDFDANGYFVNAAGLGPDDEPYAQTEPVSANDTVVLPARVGGVTVSLWGVAVNCVVHDGNPKRETIRSGDTTNIVFPVECGRKDELAYVGLTGNGDIYLVYEDGSGVRQLTSAASVEADPAWAPDGTKLAFMSDRDGNPEIYVMNADGSGVARLTNDGGADYQPSWSPDGRKIAFASDRAGNVEIFVMEADGSNPTGVTTNAGDDYAPAWSPDGRYIAFTTNRDGEPRIYVMSADGSGPERVTSVDSEYPTWAPDGYTLAYSGSECSDYYPGPCYPAVVVQHRVFPSFLGARPSWSRSWWKIAYNGISCDSSFSRCLAGPFRIARLDGPGTVTSVVDGTSPTWRPR